MIDLSVLIFSISRIVNMVFLNNSIRLQYNKVSIVEESIVARGIQFDSIWLDIPVVNFKFIQRLSRESDDLKANGE